MSKDLNLLERCTELDVDGHVDAKGVRYMGRASKAARRYLEIAVVGEALCVVEVTITPKPHRVHTAPTEP